MISVLNKMLGRVASGFSPEHPFRKAGAWAWDEFLKRTHPMLEVKLHGETLWLSSRWRSLSEEYEQEALESFLQRVNSDQIIWDIGAHIGIYSLLACKKLKVRGKVFAWEPSPGNFSQLVQHIKANRLEDQCTAFQAAITDGSADQVEFVIDESSKGGDTHRVSGQAHGSEYRRVKVKAASLDAWVAKVGYVPDLIKIDVEGAEGMVLQGGRKLLAGDFGKRPMIFLSVHPHFLWEYGWKMEALDPMMKDLGYRVVDVKGRPCALDRHAEFWCIPNDNGT